VTQVNTVLNCSQFIWTVKSDVPMVLLTPLNGMPSLYIPTVFKPRTSLTGQRKLETFLMGRPTVLTQHSNSDMLMWMKVGPTKNKKAMEDGSSLGLSSVWHRQTVQQIYHCSCSATFCLFHGPLFHSLLPSLTSSFFYSLLSLLSLLLLYIFIIFIILFFIIISILNILHPFY